MRRTLLLALAVATLLLAGAVAAAAQDMGGAPPTPLVQQQPNHAQATAAQDTGSCDGLVWGLSHLCSGVTGAIGSGVGAAVSGGAKAALSAIVEFVVDGAGWLLGRLAGLIDASTRPDVTAGWFRGAYQDMAAIAVLGLLPFLLIAIIHAIARQDPGGLLRSSFLYVPLAAIGTGAAVVVVDMLVVITDVISAWVGRSLGSDLSAFATGLGTAVAALSLPSGGATAGLAALLGAGVVAFATFVIWLELLLRQAAIYVAVLFLPLGFMAMVWPATAHWLRRLVQGLVAIILSKFVIVAVMALAATALDAQVGEEGFAVVVSGAALLSLAALAPYVLLRLIPVFEAGVTSQLEGTFRRPTAAVGPPQAARSQITQLLRQRVGGQPTAGGPPFLAAGDAAGSLGAGLTRAAVAKAATVAGAGGATAVGSAAGGLVAGAVTVGASAVRRAGARAAKEARNVASVATDGQPPVSNSGGGFGATNPASKPQLDVPRADAETDGGTS